MGGGADPVPKHRSSDDDVFLGFHLRHHPFDGLCDSPWPNRDANGWEVLVNPALDSTLDACHGYH